MCPISHEQASKLKQQQQKNFQIIFPPLFSRCLCFGATQNWLPGLAKGPPPSSLCWGCCCSQRKTFLRESPPDLDFFLFGQGGRTDTQLSRPWWRTNHTHSKKRKKAKTATFSTPQKRVEFHCFRGFARAKPVPAARPTPSTHRCRVPGRNRGLISSWIFWFETRERNATATFFFLLLSTLRTRRLFLALVRVIWQLFDSGAKRNAENGVRLAGKGEIFWIGACCGKVACRSLQRAWKSAAKKKLENVNRDVNSIIQPTEHSSRPPFSHMHGFLSVPICSGSFPRFFLAISVWQLRSGAE